MSQEEFYLFNDLFNSRFGLFFPPERKEILESRLRPRLRALNLKRFYEYYLLVRFSQNASEQACMIRDVINHETHFFRQPDQLRILFTEFEMIKKNVAVRDAFRILVAGCSSGEEAYTIKILAFENSFSILPFRPHIDAFDIDFSRVRLAMQAEYNSHSIRGIDQEQVQRYFQPAGRDLYKLKEAYRENVNFSYGNILEPETYQSKVPYDVLICRNVFIYFSEESIITALENFARCLNPGGLLLLGYSESIIGLSKYFEPVKVGGYILYRRTDDRVLS